MSTDPNSEAGLPMMSEDQDDWVVSGRMTLRRLEAVMVKWREAIAEEERLITEARLRPTASWQEEQAYGECVDRHTRNIDALKNAMANAILALYAEVKAEASGNRAENAKHNHANLPGRCTPACPQWHIR